MSIINSATWPGLLLALSVAWMCPPAIAGGLHHTDNTHSHRNTHLPPDAPDKLLALEQRLSTQAATPTLAEEFSLACIQQGRRTHHDGYFLAAQHALRHWQQHPNPPPGIHLLRALLHLQAHDFDAAQHELDLATERDALNPQVWLTRSTLLRVQGNYQAALRACLPLQTLTSALRAKICITSTTSLTGQAEKSYQILSDLLDQQKNISTNDLQWLHATLAEIAERLGWNTRADEHYQAALALQPADLSLHLAYADFLLDQQRNEDVLARLNPDSNNHAIILRRKLARMQSGNKENTTISHSQTMQDNAHKHHDTPHLRDEIRRQLHLFNQPQHALTLAKKNWRQQREPMDTRLLLQAALAAEQPSAATEVRDWLIKTQLEDVRLAALQAQLSRIQTPDNQTTAIHGKPALQDQ